MIGWGSTVKVRSGYRAGEFGMVREGNNRGAWVEFRSCFGGLKARGWYAYSELEELRK
jgi:hypothetical protein